ncbi:MAG: universal stress protein [Chloroflexi bacterium]|nr:universal stress protein [Chloroflexota bacterium]
MRFVVALDGSEPSRHAALAVGPLARAARAEVLLLEVLNPEDIRETPWAPEPATAIPASAVPGGLVRRGEPPVARLAEDRTQALERARMDAESYLKSEAAHLEGVTSTVHVVWAEHAAEAIAAFAAQQGADVLVIATHGRSGVRHVLMGSVAEAVIRQSTVPVLVVR